ncbi:DUF6134 family protein [Phenylobacterium sp.]|uniref:DUF6134 family protein n=1 Tax=Phenylobacterium sp. TaxID=1871053 RepID=UPI003567BB66
MSEVSKPLSRRAALAGGLILASAPRLVLAATPRDLTFAVFRNGSRIGEHHVTFAGGQDALTATTDAVMTVRLGPVPVFRYHHHAVETRKDSAFVSLETATSSNGKKEHVLAERRGGAVRVEGSTGHETLAADANPMNHWNPQAFLGPLFNPQTGRPLKVRATRVAPGRWQIRGEAEIDDAYDETGAWLSLTGKLDDGSRIEYRRL